MKGAIPVLVLLATLAWLAPARADDVINDEDRAAAQVLFDEGRKLSDGGDWKSACPKFQESMRLHPATGTQLNLARCYEKIDKLASAWINWVEAKQRATAAGQDKRAKIAAERADALEGRVSFITVRVTDPVDGLVVTRDDTELGSAQWDTKLPIDGGSHHIVAKADGFRTWKKKVRIKKEGAHVVVRIPRLESEEAPPPPTPTPEPTADPTPSPEPVEEPQPDDPPPDRGVSGQLIAGAVLTGLGAVGLGIGIGFGVAAMSSNDESLTHCPSSPDECSREGVDLRVQAFTFSYVSTAGFIAAGVGVLAGVIMMATVPGDEPERTGLQLVPVPHGLGLGGRF